MPRCHHINVKDNKKVKLMKIVAISFTKRQLIYLFGQVIYGEICSPFTFHLEINLCCPPSSYMDTEKTLRVEKLTLALPMRADHRCALSAAA